MRKLNKYTISYNKNPTYKKLSVITIPKNNKKNGKPLSHMQQQDNKKTFFTGKMGRQISSPRSFFFIYCSTCTILKQSLWVNPGMLWRFMPIIGRLLFELRNNRGIKIFFNGI